jgi:hypothetical protein
MDLTPFQRFAAFLAVVLVLAGLGAYLFLPQSSSAGNRGGAHHRCAGQAAGARCASPAPSHGSAGQPPSGSAAPDIYQWLPFTQSGLASAASATTAFAEHYGTFSYTESAQAYLAPMRSLMTGQLAAVLGQAFTAPGVAGPRVASKQAATATATIVALRAFGPSSLTFVVAIIQRITSTNGTSTQTRGYAITLIGTGSSWQVNDIEQASAGNQ